MTLTFEDADTRIRTDAVGVRDGLIPGGVNVNGVKARAYVNQGRWLVDCPVCPAAREANPDYHMWCVECGNSFLVEWPSKEEVRQIGDVLELRARVNQNFHPDDYKRLHPVWSPYHEPCTDGVVWLAYENDVRGIPIGNDIIKRRYEQWLAADWRKRGLAEEMAGFNVEAR